MALTPTLNATVGVNLTLTAALEAPGAIDPDPTVDPPGGSVTFPDLPAYDPSARKGWLIRRLSKTYPAPPLLAHGRLDVDNWKPTSVTDTYWAELRLFANDTDITHVNGVRTPFPRWSSSEPFGYDNATVEFPSLYPHTALPSWARLGANFRIVGRREGVAGFDTLWKGVFVTQDRAGADGKLTMTALGLLRIADLQLRDPSFNLNPLDIGILMPNILNGVISRRYKKMSKTATGIMSGVTGGWETMLNYLQRVLSTAVIDGKQYTVHLNSNDEPVLEFKDYTTITSRFRYLQPGIDVHLTRDLTQAPNIIKAEGINSNGGRWRNMRYPNWHDDATPAFPNTSPIRSMKQGDRDADTDSGTGVSTLERRLRDLGYAIKVDGYLSKSDIAVIRTAQKDLHIQVDGVPGPQTWAAVFNTGANTGSLSGAFIMPVAAVSAVMQYKYAADGSISGDNPDYDPSVVPVEMYYNLGRGVSRAEGIAQGREILKRDSKPALVGTITLTEDMPSIARMEIVEGMNFAIDNYEGGSAILHVASVEHSETATVLTVDEKARDWPTIDAIVERNRSATNPARDKARQLIQGEIQQDAPVWDAESPAGRMVRHAIFGGLWDVRKMAFSTLANVVKISMTMSSPASAGAMIVFGKEITTSTVLSTFGNPMTATDNPYERDDLDGLGFLFGIGWKDQPGGYWPKSHYNHKGVTTAPITGKTISKEQFEIGCEDSYVWVAFFSPTSCLVEARIWADTETD